MAFQPIYAIRDRHRRGTLLPYKQGIDDGSTLTLDFTKGQLDPRLTFTRASDATFINSSGRVQWADANHVQNSTMLNNTGTKWTQTTSGGTVTINGDGTVRFNGTGGRATWLQSIASLASGLPMTFSFRVTSFTNTNLRTTDLFNAGTGFTGQSYFYTDTTGTTHTLTAFESLPKSGTNGVGTYSVTATTNATSANIIFGSDCNGVGGRSGDVTITEPQLQYGTVVPRRVYVPNSSIIAAKWDSARFDHDPTTLAPRGLLIEGSAVNLCLNGSMVYTATAPTNWVRGFSGCTVASVDSTTFLGQKAWSISATASGQRDLLEQVISLAANTTYTVSVYLEAVTGTPATFAYMTSLPAGATSGTVVNPSAGRVSFTVTVGATAGSGTLRIGIGSATGTGVSADASVRFSHVQVEAGSGASSYIPTGASQGSRAADNCYIYDTTSSGGLSWFKTATQGTFYVEMFKRTAGTAFAAAGFGTRATAFQEFLLYQAVGNNWLSFNWGAGEYTTNYSALSSPFLIKAAVALSPSTPTTEADSTVSINGSNSALSTGPNIALPFTSDLFCIGSRGPAAGTAPSQNYAETAIRRIKFFPFAMTAAQMNALTTL